MKAVDGGANYPVDTAALPKTWVVARVGDVIRDIRSGFACGKHSREQGGVIHLRPMNVNREGRIELSDVRYIFPTSDLQVTAGDVLFNNTNSPNLVGKTAPIDSDEGWAFSNHMTRLRPPEGLSHRFVAYQLHFLWMSGYFRTLCKHHVNQASISSRTLSEFVPLVVPPSAEQLRIVAEIEKQLGRLDEAELLLRRTITNLERYRRMVLQRACEGALVPTEDTLARSGNRDYETGQTLLDHMAASIAGQLRQQDLFGSRQSDEGSQELSQGLFDLPPGWVWTTVGRVGDLRLGRQRSPEHARGSNLRPYLRVANVFENRIDTSDVLRMNFTPREYQVYRLERGDILLNEGQSVKLVGRAAMYNGEVPGACFQNTLVRFRARPGLNARYALVVFLHYLHSERFRAIAKWSTNIAHISAGRLATMAFPLPPRPEQDRIVAEVDRRLSVADRELDAVRSVLARGASLRRTILLQAFTGRLVPQHEQDGSAVVEAMLFQRQARDRKAGASTSRMPRKPSGEQTMPIRRSLYDVLNDAGAPLTPESLLEQSGFSEESVDDFYEELKREVLRKRIVEIRAKGSNEIALKAAKP